MNYDEIKELTLQLSYRDKLRLAQLLLQMGRKEEEEQYVEKVDEEIEYSLDYISERLHKSRPVKLQSLENFINAMFQFKGSISIEERNNIIKKLINHNIIRIENNKVQYL